MVNAKWVCFSFFFFEILLERIIFIFYISFQQLKNFQPYTSQKKIKKKNQPYYIASLSISHEWHLQLLSLAVLLTGVTITGGHRVPLVSFFLNHFSFYFLFVWGSKAWWFSLGLKIGVDLTSEILVRIKSYPCRGLNLISLTFFNNIYIYIYIYIILSMRCCILSIRVS